jgi:PAS domain S-box-containing protein
MTPDMEIIEANKAVLKHFQINRERAFGMKCYELIHGTNENIKECPCSDAISSKKAVTKEYAENGKTFELIIWPVYDEQNKLKAFTHIIKDITDRKKKEEQIRTSLSEKEVLLRELFHRSKNNMNLIMSFLILQKSYSSDEKTTVILNDVISRIQSMALIHQKLDQTKNLSKININEYIMELINMIKVFYDINNDKIVFLYDLENMDVMIDTALPLGLVLNEILTNCIKHAFINMDNKCKIFITLKKEDEKWILLEISDNGRGLPDGFDISNSRTLGMLTIFNIIEKQLDGKVEYSSSKNGLTYKIRINKNLYNERVII